MDVFRGVDIERFLLGTFPFIFAVAYVSVLASLSNNADDTFRDDLLEEKEGVSYNDDGVCGRLRVVLLDRFGWIPPPYNDFFFPADEVVSATARRSNTSSYAPV